MSDREFLEAFEVKVYRARADGAIEGEGGSAWAYFATELSRRARTHPPVRAIGHFCRHGRRAGHRQKSKYIIFSDFKKREKC